MADIEDTGDRGKISDLVIRQASKCIEKEVARSKPEAGREAGGRVES